MRPSPWNARSRVSIKEFFLLLSSTGLAYRRCELVRVNGTDMNVAFFKGQERQEAPRGASNGDLMRV
jgi:hypothetical protein